MKKDGYNGAKCCVPGFVNSKHEDYFGSEKTQTEVDMDDVPICGVSLEEHEHDDGEHHAEYGDSEANVGDVLELVSVHTLLGDELGVNIEYQGEVGEVITGALGVGVIVTQGHTAFS